MAILYNKPDALPNNSSPNYVYSSVEEAQKDPRWKGIRTKGKNYTRCFGSAIDAGGECNIGSDFSWRPLLGKIQQDKISTDLPGETGGFLGVIDAWNAYDAIKYNKEKINLLYDRHSSGQEVTDEMLTNLPLYSMIGTGDARQKYIDPNYEHKRSRHAITVVGYLATGEPLIYDLGKISIGIPEKYKGKINYIAAPSANAKYFKNKILAQASVVEEKATAPGFATEKVKEMKTATKESDGQEVTVPKSKQVVLNTVKPSTYARDFISLINQTFNIS